jgi:hypothetical protein
VLRQEQKAINPSTWPDAKKIHERLLAYHRAIDQLASAYNAIPDKLKPLVQRDHRIPAK